MGKRFGNAMGFVSGGTTVAGVVQADDVQLRMDYSRFGADGEFFRERVIAVHRNVRRGLRARWEMGKALAEIQERAQHGTFGTILREEFDVDNGGMSMTSVYDVIKLYREYPEFERIAGAGAAVARLLTTGTTPQEAKEEILAQLQADGRVPKAQADEIVERHRRRGTRSLTLEETMALIWWRVKAATGHGAGDAVRLAWLEENGGFKATAAAVAGWMGDGAEGVRLDTATFGEALAGVQEELGGRIEQATAMAARAAAGRGVPRVIDGEARVLPTLPPELAARGWVVRLVWPGPKVYGFRTSREGGYSAATAPAVSVEAVVAAIREKEGLSRDVMLRVSEGTAVALGRALGDARVREVLGEAAWAELWEAGIGYW